MLGIPYTFDASTILLFTLFSGIIIIFPCSELLRIVCSNFLMQCRKEPLRMVTRKLDARKFDYSTLKVQHIQFKFSVTSW